METALYYTLSTIAQTLAGALAILVAVVLFRLAMLRALIEEAQDTSRSYSVDPSVYWPVVRAFGYDAMANRLQEDTNSDVHQNQTLRRAYEAAVTAYRDWDQVNRRLRAALAVSIADIAFCFFLLPFSPALKGHRVLAVLILALSVTLGIVCLGLYWRLMAALVRRPDD